MHTMLLYLERYNDNETRNFNEVQAEATYVRVKQVLLGEDNFSTFNRKKRSRLSFLVFRRIRDGTNFVNNHRLNDEQNQFLLDLIQNTRQQILNSRAYLDDNNTEAIRLEDCLRPEMTTAIKKYKIFNLVPLYSFQRKYVSIDIAYLKYLLSKVRREAQSENLFDEGDSENKHEIATYAFSQVFDFGSVRLYLNYNEKEMFTNTVRTDGYVIDFMLAGPKRQLDKLPDLDLNDFTTEEINENFHLWSVDPGQVNIYTASDGHGTNPHQVRKYSTAEYYTRAGLKITNQHILNYKNANLQLLEAKRQIITFKTANLERFTEYVRSVLNNLNTLLTFYDDRFTALRFLNYIGFFYFYYL
ncbi:hypothetical protein MFLAVUS_002054 [Mucor flavus]|uniref:Uncharacterized protein n=1 Tax=Mucor flavus TaxID=439312 RepID=A0ABP9YP77_9FUNG